MSEKKIAFIEDECRRLREIARKARYNASMCANERRALRKQVFDLQAQILLLTKKSSK